MLNDTLSDALSKIFNAEKSGRDSCVIRPSSKTILQVLEIMKTHGYLGAVNEEKDTKGNKLSITIIGTINKCGVIKPRFPVKKGAYERFEKTYLPAKDFGILIVSTSKGIMTHIEAKRQGLGGRLVSYCY